jgi:uridine kinase
MSVPDSSETTDLFDRAETTDTNAEPEETTDAADDTEFGMAGDEPSSRRVFFVGIAGPSCGGKSTLASRLAAQFRSPVNPVPLDGYCMPAGLQRQAQDPQAFDFKALLEDLHAIEKIFSSVQVVPESLVIKADPSRGGGNIIRHGVARSPLALSQPVVVVVEGHLLFYDTMVSSMFDAHLWLQADCQTCCSRRHRRDCPSEPIAKFSDWYNSNVWSSFLKYQGRQLTNADGALRLNAVATIPAILEEAYAYSRARLGLV